MSYESIFIGTREQTGSRKGKRKGQARGRRQEARGKTEPKGQRVIKEDRQTTGTKGLIKEGSEREKNREQGKMVKEKKPKAKRKKKGQDLETHHSPLM